MNLLLPLGLAALVALPIVVLLHMRHTTPLPRPVPTLRFWLAVEPERTEQNRFRRPPLSVLLLLHLAIAALLAFALARPATTRALDGLGLGALGGLRTEPRHLILLLDGSTSMAATDTPSGRTRFEEARARTLDRLEGLREGDVATLLLLGTRTSTLGATDAGSLSLLRERVADLAPPGGRADLDAALSLARDLLLPDLDDEVIVLSDGAVAADPATVARLGAPVELALVGGERGAAGGNVAVVDLAARASPSNPELLEVYARVMNFGSDPVQTSAALIGDGGLEIGRQPITLPPNGGTQELNWPLPPGTGAATIRVEAPDALAADNEASLVLRQGEGDLALRILLVSDAPGSLQRALQALDGAQVTTEPSGNAAAALGSGTYDLIVFEKSLPPPEASAELGAPLLFVNPPAGGPFPSEGSMPEPTVSELRTQDPLLAGVDLAGTTFGPTPIYQLDGTQTEVVGAAEGPLLFRGRVGEQPAVVFAFDPAASNLPRRVAFPILVANVVAELAPSPLPAAVPLGDPLRYRPRADASAVRVAPPAGEPIELPLAVEADGAPTAGGDPAAAADEGEGEGAAPPARLREVAFVDTGQPGTYAVAELDAAGAELGGGRFVVNAGHPRESDLRPNPDLADTLAAAQASGADGQAASRLTDFWPLLVAVGLLLLALEWLVALLPRRRSTRLRPAIAGLQPPVVGRR